MSRLLASALAATAAVLVPVGAWAACTLPSTTLEAVWCVDTLTSITAGPLGLAQFSEPNVYVASANGVLAFTEASGGTVGSTPFYQVPFGKSVSTKIVPAHYTSNGSGSQVGVLLFAATDGYLYNVDASSGTCYWRTYLGRTGATNITDVGCVSGDLANNCGDQVTSEPALYYNATETNALVYVATNDGVLNSCSGTQNRVYAIDVATGVPAWTFNASGSTSVADIPYAVGPDVYQESACPTNRNQVITLDNNGEIWLLNWQTGALISSTTGLLGGGYAPSGYLNLAYATSKCGASFVPAVSGTTGEIAQISFDTTATGACGGSPPCSASFAGITIPSGLQSPLSLNVSHEGAATGTGAFLSINSHGTNYLESPSVNCSFQPARGSIAEPFVLTTSAGPMAYTGTNEGSIVQIPITGAPSNGSTCTNQIERLVSASPTTTLGDPGADFTSSGTAYVFMGDAAGRMAELTAPFATGSLIVNVTGLTGPATIHYGSSTLAANSDGIYVLTQTAGSYSVYVSSATQTCTPSSGSPSNVTLTAAGDVDVNANCNVSGQTLYTLSATITGAIIGSAVTLEDSSVGATDTITSGVDGTFSFPYQVASGKAYDVVVSNQPTGSACVVAGATGTMGSNVTVSVTCSCQGAYPSQCGNACVNLKTDDNNCGSCNTPCGNKCVNGLCKLVDTSSDSPFGLAEDTNNLYYINTNLNIRTATKSSGAVTLYGGATAYQINEDDGGAPLPDGGTKFLIDGGLAYTTVPVSLTVDSTYLYYTTNIINNSTSAVGGGTVGRVLLGSINTQNECLYDPSSGYLPGTVETDGTYMYWTDQTGVRQYQISKFSGKITKNDKATECLSMSSPSVTTLATLTGVSPMGIDVSSPDAIPGISPLAIAATGTSNVSTLATTGGSLTTIGTSQSNVTLITSDGTRFYWTEQTGGITGSVAYAPVSGGSGTATVLWHDTSHAPYAIATDGYSVYWGTTDGYVYKMAIGDEVPTQMGLDTDGDTITGVVVDSTSVYWTDTGANAIMQTKK